MPIRCDTYYLMLLIFKFLVYTLPFLYYISCSLVFFLYLNKWGSNMNEAFLVAACILLCCSITFAHWKNIRYQEIFIQENFCELVTIYFHSNIHLIFVHWKREILFSYKITFWKRALRIALFIPERKVSFSYQNNLGTQY